MRAFIAIKLPTKFLMEVKEIQEKLPEFFGKKTELKNMHLTLKFLGEVPSDKILHIKEKLRDIKFKKFETSIGNIGIFDNLKSKKSEENIIVWLSLNNCEGIQREIDEILFLDGLSQKEKVFMGHITVARVKKIQNRKKFLEDLKKIVPPNIFFIVDNFYLIESKLTKEGPEYTVLEEYNLD